MAQLGKPYALATDGPNSFSCTGLIRHILRTIGVDEAAPWDHGAYLGTYPTVATPAAGDVVVYPSGVAMYLGNDTVLMANDADGRVGTYPLYSIGTPLGFARPPYAGGQPPVEAPLNGATDPLTQSVEGIDQVIDPITGLPVSGELPMLDPTTGLPVQNAQEQVLDPTTGLPPVQDVQEQAFDPYTGLPVDGGQQVDPYTGLPVQGQVLGQTTGLPVDGGQQVDPYTGLPVQDQVLAPLV